MNPSDYWRRVCAPEVRARKREIGRSMTNTEIAAEVEAKSGKATTRQLLEMFFRGEREPYISQLVALCGAMDMDMMKLIGGSTAKWGHAIQVEEGRQSSAVSHKKRRIVRADKV